MSGEGNPTGQRSTTTVSYVAIQAGESRIVIAVLKSGELVQLQLAEAIPNLLETGKSQEEAKKLLQDHNALLYKIKSLEDNVWDLLCEADKTAEENKDQSQVYDAMALTLKEAWDALILMLENRRDLLQMTAEFFDIALQFSEALDNAEAFLQDTPNTNDSITNHLEQLQQHTKALLAQSLTLLNKSRELTEFIQQFRSQKPVANCDIMKGSHSSCFKVEGLLETLQDRRRQLDKQMRQHRQRLEQVLHVSQWHQQEDKVTCWLRKQIDLYLSDVQLGASLTENEELLHKHKQLVLDSKEWTTTFEKLKAEAALKDVEKRNNSYEKLNVLHTEFWKRMDRRQALLLDANHFFKCVNKTFDKLGSVESYLKHLKMQTSGLQLETQRKEAEAEIQRCTSEAFHQGQALLKKSPFSPGMNGIQEMIGYLQKRVDQLIGQSPASMENSLKQQEITMLLEDHLKKISTWIHNINTGLESHSNPDSINECEDVRYKLGELAKQTKEASKFMESIVQLIREVAETAPSGGEGFSRQSRVLDEELKALDQSIDEKLEVINVYIAFIKSSEALDSHIQHLKEAYAYQPEEISTATLEAADTQIQGVLDELFSVQDMGQNCLNIIKMMNKNRILKDKHVLKVEQTMATLNKERAQITNLWSTWRQQVNQINSSKYQWRTIKDQLRLANSRLQELEQDLQPLSLLILENDTQNIVHAQENLYNIKEKFQKLDDEMEQAVKISELLAREGTQINVKTGKIHDLAQYQQRLKDTITEYEEFFIQIVTFHRMKAELSILKTELEQSTHSHAMYDNQPVKRQEQQAHIQSLYTIILNLGAQIISTAQHSKYITVSLHDLQHQIADLERDSMTWNSNVKNQEENVSGDLPRTTIEEVNELKESFKDLKKKFNNLKFNYTKKADKGRNLKVIKNQIQQVEMYAEKMQILKKKMENLERKMSPSNVPQQLNKADIIQESMSDLQKHMNEFSGVMKDYKVYLEMAEDLQHIMEESHFWCEEACATVVRVGRYSAECKTKESVEVLLKQFNKFVEPTVPQQEERIQQMTNIAKHIFGAEDGMKYIEKTLLKHKEALISVNDLCVYLKELEEKLQEPQKVPEMSISKETGETVDLPVTPKDGSIQVDTDLQPELLAEEAVSGDEYECISPDDISLPPLAETPESNLPQSETEQDEQPCYSSHSMHVTSYSMQMHINTSGKKVTDCSDFLTPAAFSDMSSHRKEKEKTPSYTDRLYSPTVGCKAESPFSHHSTIVNETRFSLSTSPAKTKPNSQMMNEVHETHLQRCSVYESTEKAQQLHASDNTARTKDRAHATPDEFSGLVFQLDPAKSCQKHTVTQEAIRSVSGKHNSVSRAGQSPAFSKHPHNVTVKEGSPVTLEVAVTGYPEPALTWYRKNKRHSSDEQLIGHEKQLSQALFIQEESDKDTCRLLARTSVYKATITPISDAKLTESRSPRVPDVDWITLFVIYFCVSVMYWIFC